MEKREMRGPYLLTPREYRLLIEGQRARISNFRKSSLIRYTLRRYFRRFGYEMVWEICGEMHPRVEAYLVKTNSTKPDIPVPSPLAHTCPNCGRLTDKRELCRECVFEKEHIKTDYHIWVKRMSRGTPVKIEDIRRKKRDRMRAYRAKKAWEESRIVRVRHNGHLDPTIVEKRNKYKESWEKNNANRKGQAGDRTVESVEEERKIKETRESSGEKTM